MKNVEKNEREDLRGDPREDLDESQDPAAGSQENPDDLERELGLCVDREQSVSIEVWRCLKEVERKKLHLARGYDSLFSYCTEKLKYSESEAQVRISCMRLMRAIPGVEGRLARRILSMTVASLIYGVCRRHKLSPEAGAELVVELSGLSKRAALQKLAEKFPSQVRPERKRFVDGEHTEIRFTLNREESALVEKLLDLTAHTNFGRSYKEAFLRLARKEIRKREGKPARDTSPHGPGRQGSAGGSGHPNGPDRPRDNTNSKEELGSVAPKRARRVFRARRRP